MDDKLFALRTREGISLSRPIIALKVSAFLFFEDQTYNP
jgi:hypothetical protein